MSNTTYITDLLTATARDAAIIEALVEKMLNEGEGGETAILVMHQVSRLRKELDRGAEGAHEQEVAESMVMLGKPDHLNSDLLEQLRQVKGDEHGIVLA